ncbi:MAG: PSD1 and planctomycete cytochrome C domain-containing protein [Planctomycetes bacterium]|nr:PSD1 and planctomycete cytochrome C domain-containing protein [Planctomycetota bacterium]
MIFHTAVVGLALAAVYTDLPRLTAAEAEPIRFNRDVRPILASACFGCHGQAKQKSELRLDTAEAAYAKNKKSGLEAIVARRPAASEAIRRIFATNEAEVMPPLDSHKKLTPEQKAILKRWVEEGAVYEPHWAFTPIAKPAVPKANGLTNPIDAFLGERLASLKLAANEEADRPTLIRRVSFTLTGLPPTLKEVDAYLADQKEGAYERMVDRYLASPHYGETMARHWLDLARYADTHGLHLDNERGMWLYRDWVVRSFNENKRFDAFTVEQLAGDLLPNPTRDQLVATGFNRCNVTTGEGGSIDTEWYFRNAVDRTAVAAETWLGLTAGCAQCHDHKFDPISQKDFYSLYAFFYSAAGSPLDGNALLHEPSIKMSTPEQEKKLVEFDRRLQSLDVAIAGATARYVDPALSASIVLNGREALDPTHSYLAWISTKGGPDAAKLPKEITAIFAALNNPGQKPSTIQKQKLEAYFLRAVCPITDVVLDPLMKSKELVTAEKTKLEQSIPSSMIFRDAPTPRQAFVMLRGQYDKPGDKVEPNTPAAFPRLKTTSRPTRLDLARWMVGKENPLTARVYVNRLWQQFFGLGLVKTSNDFGLQGEPPTHMELLDWLAADFRDGGWDIRATVRLMLTSAAFRRSSKVTPTMLQADPENRLYARGPRFRLDAEQVRDNALYLSGLLDLTMGGKGVKPYQPDNIWEPVGFTGSNTANYKRDSGNALYRRTLYTFFKRTAPPPFMANFDTPNREQPCSRRDRSNTPLQALQLLNDIQHVEAARAFAERIMTEGGATETDRLTYAFRLILARAPTSRELSILKDEWNVHLARYKKAPGDAAKLIAIGEAKAKLGLKSEEVAAYTLVASMLLNLDETLTRN